MAANNHVVFDGYLAWYGCICLEVDVCNMSCFYPKSHVWVQEELHYMRVLFMPTEPWNETHISHWINLSLLLYKKCAKNKSTWCFSNPEYITGYVPILWIQNIFLENANNPLRIGPAKPSRNSLLIHNFATFLPHYPYSLDRWKNILFALNLIVMIK